MNNNTNRRKGDKHALLICDYQKVVCNSISSKRERRSVTTCLDVALQVARQLQQKVIWMGLAFEPGYPTVSPHNKLYGPLRKFQELSLKNPALQNAPQCWYQTDHADTQFCQTPRSGEVEIWRHSHLLSPAQQDDLLQTLSHVESVTVVGFHTGVCVQAMVQWLCSCNQQVAVISDAVGDAHPKRHQAVLEHLLPTYANQICSISNWIDDIMGLESFRHLLQQQLPPPPSDDNDHTDRKVRYFAACQRGGHFFLYTQHQLEQSSTFWRPYPTQHWYTDESILSGGKSTNYLCPLGKRVVDFCDEPQFSKSISMFVKGREWLDEKDKLYSLSLEIAAMMPPNYVLLRNHQWKDANPSTNDSSGPWFLKECNKNGGTAVQVFATIKDCLELASRDSMYVLQPHIANPLLTHDGRKCHVKVYNLLVNNHKNNGDDDQDNTVSNIWKLYTYPEAFLSTSPNPWSCQDVSVDTQITTKRHERLVVGQASDTWSGWTPEIYQRFQSQMATVVQVALAERKLQSRRNHNQPQRQFELFSADFLLDTDLKSWLIECNFGPVLFDPMLETKQPLTTPGLLEYQRLFNESDNKKAVAVNDHAMISDTVQLVFFHDVDNKNKNNQWDLAGTWNDKGETTS